MNKKETIYQQAVRNFFKGDAFVEDIGIKIADVDEEKTTVVADVLSKHLNGNGCVQGGMLYTLADFAFAVHSNYLHPATVTQGGHIYYLRPAFCKRIIATAKETARTGHNSLAEVVITDENGNTLCVCNFNGFIKDTDKEEFIKKYSETKDE
ncbi:MAG: hotdog fold thioesterase [Clostridia bacterium]|nr:hotdog fold thioesterase [Clostridia bacterium]